MGSMPESPPVVKPIDIWPINLLTPLFPEIPIMGFLFPEILFLFLEILLTPYFLKFCLPLFSGPVREEVSKGYEFCLPPS